MSLQARDDLTGRETFTRDVRIEVIVPDRKDGIERLANENKIVHFLQP